MRFSPSCGCCACLVHDADFSDADASRWELAGGASITAGQLTLPSGATAISTLPVRVDGHRIVGWHLDATERSADAILQYVDADNFTFIRKNISDNTLSVWRRNSGVESLVTSTPFVLPGTQAFQLIACFEGGGTLLPGMLKGLWIGTRAFAKGLNLGGNRVGFRNPGAPDLVLASAQTFNGFALTAPPNPADQDCYCVCRCGLDVGPWSPAHWSLELPATTAAPFHESTGFLATCDNSIGACKSRFGPSAIGFDHDVLTATVILTPLGGDDAQLKVTFSITDAVASQQHYAEWETPLSYSSDTWYGAGLVKSATNTISQGWAKYDFSGSTMTVTGLVPE